MKRSILLSFLIVANFIVWADAADARPNVLFVIADQWRGQAFGFAGDANVKTPHLDAFEKGCVNFTQAVSGMAVCSPGRASLLTGQRPLTHGVFLNDVPLSQDAVTLAKVLEAAGYETGCIGKWHVDGHGSRSAFIPRERRQGFEYWKVLECTHDYNRSFYYADGPEKLTWEGYDAIAQTRDACGIRCAGRRGSRFCSGWRGGRRTIRMRPAPAKYREMYSGAEIKLRANVPKSAEERRGRTWRGITAHCTGPGRLLWAVACDAGGDGAGAEYDRGVYLRSRGHAVVAGRAAEAAALGGVGEGADAGRTPGVKAGRNEATINTEDVMPTILRLCGREVPKSVEGLDFSGVMSGEVDPSSGATVIRCVAPFGE